MSERLTDEQRQDNLDELSPPPRKVFDRDWGQVMMDGAHVLNTRIVELMAENERLRAECDEALRMARDAVQALQGSVSLWPRDYPAWLVYALLGGVEQDASIPLSDIGVEGSPYTLVRALVALVEPEGDERTR